MELFALNEDVATLEFRLSTLEGGERLSVLLALAWQLRQRDCARALLLAQEAETGLRQVDVSDAARQAGMARLRLVRGELAWLFVDLVAAEDHATAAIASFEQLGDPVGAGDGKALLASVWLARGNAKRRDEYLEQASQDYRVGGDQVRFDANTARSLYYAAFRDAHAVAARLAAMSDSATPHSASVTAWLAAAQAVVAGLHGDFGASVRYFFQAHSAAEACGHIRQAIWNASNAADCFATLGDLDTALEWNERASTQARQTGWPGAIGLALLQTGNVLRLLGRHAAAKSTLSDALTALEQTTQASSYAVALHYLGELALDMGDPHAALDYFRQSEESARTLSDSNLVVRCWRGQASALSRLGQAPAAIAKIEAALTLATEQGIPGEQIKVLRVYANLCQRHAVPPPTSMTAPSPALHYLNRAMAVAATIAGFTLPSELLDEVAAAYAACGDYQHAYANGQAAARIRDSKRLDDARNRALAMQVRQETERLREEGERHLQQAQVQAQRAAALQESSAILETLELIGREITASLNANAVFETLARHVSQLLDVASFHVYLLAPEGQLLQGMFGVEGGLAFAPDPVAIHDPRSIIARCAQDREAVLVEVAPDSLAQTTVAQTRGTVSRLCTPLLIGDRLQGVMVIQSSRSHAYGEREQRILRTLSAYGAIALDNAAAYRQLESTLSSLREAQARLEEVSITDPLTGLRNRRFLMQHIETDIALVLRRYEQQADDPAQPGALGMDLVFFMLDLDHFKSVNDRYGHAAGDRVLVQLRKRLLQVFRESDYLIRWGGEEFLLVARASDRADAAAIAERIRLAIANQAFELADGITLTKTCSIGFASFPFLPGNPRWLSWAQVVEMADQGLYLAKQGGRNGWVGVCGTGNTPTRTTFQQLIEKPIRADRAGELRLIVSAGLILAADGSTA